MRTSSGFRSFSSLVQVNPGALKTTSVLLLAIAISLSSSLRIKRSPIDNSRADRFTDFCFFAKTAQDRIITALEEEEKRYVAEVTGAYESLPINSSPIVFERDQWERKATDSDEIEGEGATCVLQRGNIFEKAGVSTTFTTGTLSKQRAEAISGRRGIKDVEALVGTKYYAAALSLVLHSKSPMVPTFRSDIRYFELSDGCGWFGGGSDLTPYVLYEEDVGDFHRCLKATCDQYNRELYPVMKKQCDDYFYLPIREEHRGTGGIFFDDLNCIQNNGHGVLNENNFVSTHENRDDLALVMSFVKDICNTWMPSYLPIVRRRCRESYTSRERHWQEIRRGRYIEFNMLYDRGVKFGLVPGGRIEAVFVSCPPKVAWDYNYQANENEQKLIDILKKPKSWVS